MPTTHDQTVDTYEMLTCVGKHEKVMYHDIIQANSESQAQVLAANMTKVRFSNYSHTFEFF